MLATHRHLLPYYGIFIILAVLCRNHIFFWDTYQLCGKQSWALYEHGLFNWILPAEIDSGHPPLFGLYHAALWKLFTPSLVISHLAMIPFLCGIVYYFHKIGTQLLNATSAIFLLPFLLVDPVFMGQAVLVSPDLVLIFFMLMTVYGLLKKSSKHIWIGALGLGMISMRGMMVLAALMLYDFFVENKDKSISERIYAMTLYAPAVISVLAFLVFHYAQTGWFGHHKDSSWAESFEYVDGSGFVKNVAVYIWRMLDFGRVFLIAPLLFMLWMIRKGKLDTGLQKILPMLLCMVIVLTPVLLVHKGLLLHRYMLPIFLLLSILFWYLLFSIGINFPKRIFKTMLGMAFIGLLTGNLWVYPKKISQAWDATLGHIPYYHLRDKMNDFVAEQEIPIEEVGTAFPNIGELRNFDPSLNSEGYKAYNLETDNYIYYSNIYNDFSDAEIDALESEEWMEIKKFQFYPVCMILYKKQP